MFLFFNASNFIDGVNGLYASTIIYWIVSLLFLTKHFSFLFFVLILSLLIFLYFNVNNKVFLGIQGMHFCHALLHRHIFLLIINIPIFFVTKY